MLWWTMVYCQKNSPGAHMLPSTILYNYCKKEYGTKSLIVACPDLKLQTWAMSHVSANYFLRTVTKLE